MYVENRRDASKDRMVLVVLRLLKEQKVITSVHIAFVQLVSEQQHKG